jgi:hypothetical protein
MTTTKRRPGSSASVDGFNPNPLDLHHLRKSADEYLLDHVGDLLIAGEPELSAGGWLIPILLSTNRRGVIGEVGKLRASRLGTIESLTANESEEVDRRAREVATGSAH